ncbi:MAG: hypothetical protein ABI595_14475, partial [Actinomycetota bacterium]
GLVLAGIGIAWLILDQGSSRDTGAHATVGSSSEFGDGSVSFQPASGWTLLQGGTLSACITTGPFTSTDIRQTRELLAYELLGCRATAAALLPVDVLVTAWAYDPYAWAKPNVNFPAATIPPTLDPSSCGVAAFEGQPPSTTECHVWVEANDRLLQITVWFGTESPSSALLATAQEGLDTLVVSEPASLGNDIAFEPAEGWHDQAVTPTSGNPAWALPVAWTSNIPLPIYSGAYLPAGPSNDDIANLPQDGVIVSVSQYIPTDSPSSTDQGSVDDAVPLQLSDARLLHGGWEGLSVGDVSQLYMRVVVDGRPVVVQAFFHTTDPTADLIKQAQIALNRLVIVPAS